MSPFPTSFAPSTQSLSDLLPDQSDTELLRQLADKNYEIQLGLTSELAKTITKVATQASIRMYCPNDSGDRFRDKEAAEKWLSKGRATFLLLKNDPNGEQHLAGYGWSGRGTTTVVPEGETTFALRISETDQGNGLATPFAQLIISATSKLYGAPHLWLETWASNGGAVHTYQKIGFFLVTEKPGDRPTQDGTTVPDTRLYMTLSENTKAE